MKLCAASVTASGRYLKLMSKKIIRFECAGTAKINAGKTVEQQNNLGMSNAPAAIGAMTGAGALFFLFFEFTCGVFRQDDGAADCADGINVRHA